MRRISLGIERHGERRQTRDRAQFSKTKLDLDTLGAVAPFDREHVGDEVVERLRYICEQLGEPGSGRRDQSSERRDRRCASVWRAPSAQFKQRGTERIDVTTHIEGRLASRLLRRHVRGRSRDRAPSGGIGGRHSEVDQLHVWEDAVLAPPKDEDVGGLDVAMRDAGRVRHPKRARNLTRTLERGPKIEARRGNHPCKVASFQPFHGDEGRPSIKVMTGQLDGLLAE